VAGPVFGLVGALAAVPRRIAARDAARRGFILHRGTTRRTTHAVFGRRLLDRVDDTAIADRLAAERKAGRTVLSENGFLRRLAAPGEDPARALPRPTVLEQSSLSPDDFDRLALFDAFEHDAEPFSLRDVILARKYAGLIAGGADWGGIARSVHRMGSAVSLTARALKPGRGTVYAEAGERLAELDGQLLLGFAEPEPDAEWLFDAAEAEERRGAHAQAAALYGRCHALDPTDAVAAYNRANCLRAGGHPAEAERDYLRALRHDASLVEAWFNLSALVAENGQPGAARRHLESAIAEDPDYADAVFNLAALAFDAGDGDTAGRCWRRYLELDPASDWATRARRGLHFLAAQSAAG
jgi:tetratricopeptide (TPR) repeat protein